MGRVLGHSAIRAVLVTLSASALCAQYTGSSACRDCHAEEFRQQSASAHAHALAIAPAGSPGQWAFGAGQKAVTYVSRTSEDWYVEHGLSFYASTKAFAPTPGHKGSADLPYPALAPGASIARCFRCHSTGTPRLGAGLAIEPAENGVRCEACHGPGAEHVRTGGRAGSIGNPGRLNATELNQFCGACHRRPPEAGEVNEGRIAVGLKFDWSNAWNTRHQPAYLSQSACFRSGGGKLNCLTCHDPHGDASLSAAAADRHCTPCHESVRHSGEIAGSSCVSCHMPSVPATPEMHFTNHWIGVYGKGNPLTPVNRGSLGLAPLVQVPTAESKHGVPNDPATLRPLFEQALSAREKQSGSNSFEAARASATLGLFLKETGAAAGAEAPLRRALAIDHSRQLRNAASDAEELAQILEATGRRKEAIDLFREAAAGTDGQVAARSYADLARLDPSNAVTHFSNAVAAEEKASGKGSPRVATQLSNLALTLRAKGDLKKAEPLLRRALAIQEQAFGRRHYQTATTISNLGAVVQGLGNLTEAESLDREALAVFEVTLPKSLELAAICANLGDLLAAKGDRAAAAGMFRRAVALDESVSGPETLEVAADLISLAAQVRVIENPAAAAQYLRRALSIYEKRLGANSPQARDLRRQLTSGSH